MTDPLILSENTSSVKEDRLFLVRPFASPLTERSAPERKLRLLAGGRSPAALHRSALAPGNSSLACMTPARRPEKNEAPTPRQSEPDSGFHFLKSLGVKVILES